jgi:hypothetical protein
VGLAIAAAEDSTTVIDEALTVAKLMTVPGIRDLEQARDLADGVARLDAAYNAQKADAPLRVHPSVVLRRLENIARALRDRRLPTKRALKSPGVAAALSHAGVDVFNRLFEENRIDRARQKGARAKPMELIEEASYGQGLHFVDKAIKRIRAFEAERRGRSGVRLGRHADDAKTKLVAEAAGLFWAVTGQHPTRRGEGPLTAFELFLELMFAGRTGNNGRALARRWRRHMAERDRGRNVVQRPSAAA